MCHFAYIQRCDILSIYLCTCATQQDLTLVIGEGTVLFLWCCYMNKTSGKLPNYVNSP